MCFGYQKSLKIKQHTSPKNIVFRGRFQSVFLRILEVFWSQQIISFLKNRAPKASFEAALLQGCIFAVAFEVPGVDFG